MKKFIYLILLSSFLGVYGEKLERPIRLQETRLHLFGFDKSDLLDTPYFSSSITSKETKFYFDGENFCTLIGDTTLNSPVKSFKKTAQQDEDSWQYIIVLDDTDSFPICIEIDFLKDKTVLLKYPMMDTKTGNLFGYNISECFIIQ